MIRDYEIGPVEWSEDLQFPFCDFCVRDKTCACPAKDQEECDFCTEGCQCGYEEAQRYGYGQCDCECTCDEIDEEAIDAGEECEVCEEGGCICGADEYPDYCMCECECKYKCSCRCRCKPLVIEHTSFNKWVKENCYVCPEECLDDKFLIHCTRDAEGNLLDVPTEEEVLSGGRCRVQLGNFEFNIMTIPAFVRKKIPIRTMQEIFGMPMFLTSPEERKYEIRDEASSMKIAQDNKKGFVRFDGPIHLPGLRTYDPHSGKPTTWMSLTPMEVFTQKPGIDLAQGRVLVGGLGMGWMTYKLLQKANVDSVAVVDLDESILNFFGTPLLEMFPGQVELFHANFWEFINDTDLSQFDTILVDIWPGYEDARRDRNFKQLKLDHPNVWGWGRLANRKPFTKKKTTKKKTKKKLTKKKRAKKKRRRKP